MKVIGILGLATLLCVGATPGRSTAGTPSTTTAALQSAPANSIPRPAIVPPCRDRVILGAARLANAGELDRAEKAIESLLTRTETAPCAAELAVRIETARKHAADESLASIVVKALSKSGRSILILLIEIVPFALLIGLGLGISRGISAWRRKKPATKWKVRSVTMGSDPSILIAWRRALDAAPAQERVNSNLLIQSGLPLPRNALRGGSPNVDATAIIDTAPQIGGFSPSWIVRILRYLLQVATSPRRTFALVVTAHDKSAIMRVEATYRDAKVRTASAAAAWTGDADVEQEIAKMAAELALKTNYLIAGETDGIGYPQNMGLREGIRELQAYSDGSDVTALREAARTFSEAARATDDPRGVLFEGIARELLEEHDAARSLFRKIIAGQAANSPLQLQGRYNLAVTHLRAYTKANVDAAEKEFAAITATIDGIAQDKRSKDQKLMRAFAQAGEANAIAHKFIFLSEYKKPQPRVWHDQATGLIEEARQAVVDQAIAMDVAAKTQLEWLAANAKGNLALNRAGADEKRGTGTPTQIHHCREAALVAFRTCESLVTPGVETLTNIATTLLKLNRPTEALSYAVKARNLNPLYEYAYMREFESEKARDEPLAARKVLHNASRELGVIKIPEFRQEFRDASVQFHER